MNYGIINKIYGKDEINKIQSKIDMLGNNRKINFSAKEFLLIRIILTIVLTFILFIFMDSKYYLIPFFVILFYFIFYYIFITEPLKKRIIDLDREALMFFEVLTLALESGKNLENSLEVTITNVDGDLSHEFRQCLYETKLGKSLIEALTSLKSRIPSDTINNIILNILQTNEFGNSIIDVMKLQVKFLREKQLMSIKEAINKIPNKVSVISVVFIIPLILLIIIGPLLIKFLG